jgi:hypothetical protein
LRLTFGKPVKRFHGSGGREHRDANRSSIRR